MSYQWISLKTHEKYLPTLESEHMLACCRESTGKKGIKACPDEENNDSPDYLINILCEDHNVDKGSTSINLQNSMFVTLATHNHCK